MKTIKLIWRWCFERYQILADKKFTTIAGTLVYFLILSVVPFTFWLTLLFGKFLAATEEVLSLEIFSEVKELLLLLQENARIASASAGGVLAATSLYSASNFFYHLRVGGEIIYEYRRQKGGLKTRVVAVLFTFVIMVTLIVFLAVFVGTSYILRFFLLPAAAETASYVLLSVMAFSINVILNVYLCPYRIRLKEIWKGSFLTTALWAAASVGFSVYLQFGNLDKLYGAITAVVVFLLWAYVMTVCFVTGVVYNERHAEKRQQNGKILPLFSGKNQEIKK